MTRYASLASLFYDLDKPTAPPEALEFYRLHAERIGGPILEPMCGSGRYLLPLLAAGYDIEGVDLSPAMLAACQRRAETLNLSPKLREQRIQSLDLGRSFALIFIPSGSFCLLTEADDVRQVLDRLWSALLPGGTLLIEVERAADRRPETSGTWGGRWLDLPDGSKLIVSWLGQYSGVEQISRSIHRYEHVRAGKLIDVEYEDFAVRFYEPEQFREELVRAGFVSIELLKPYREEPADDSDEAVVFRARRPG